MISSEVIFSNTLILTRDLPVCAVDGAMVYSNQIIRVMAEISIKVTVVCMAEKKGQKTGVGIKFPGFPQNISFDVCESSEKNLLYIALSGLPVAVSSFDTRERRSAIKDALNTQPDCILFSSFMSISAIDILFKYYRKKKPFVIYCSHNHEFQAKMSIIKQNETNIPQKIVHYIDARRIAALEKRVFQIADILACISDEDKKRYAESFSRLPKKNLLSSGL